MTTDGSKGQYWRLNTPDVVAEELDGEVVIVDLKTGAYFSLLNSASVIWEELEPGFELPAVISRAAAKFAGDVVLEEIAFFIDQLIGEGLFIATDDPGRASATAEYSEEKSKHPYSTPRFEAFSDMKELLELDPIHEVIDSGWPNRA